MMKESEGVGNTLFNMSAQAFHALSEDAKAEAIEAPSRRLGHQRVDRHERAEHGRYVAIDGARFADCKTNLPERSARI